MDAKESKKEYFNTVVIGGGAAGMMAAIAASQNGARVALIEKNSSLGKKLLLTGNGRCNITQAEYDNRIFAERIGKNGKFLFSSLAVFGPKETVSFFQDMGLQLKTEESGRVFPVSGKAQDVLAILIQALRKNGVEIMLNQNVLGIKTRDGKVACVELSDKKIYADSFILSVGGKAYPTTGSTGSGYSWLRHIGHNIVPPAPALVPIKIRESWIKNMRGLSLKNITLNLIQDNRKIRAGSGELLFTHFGLSGPVILNASKYIGKSIENGEPFLELDLLPALSLFQLEEKLKQAFESYGNKNLKTHLLAYFPKKLVLQLMELCQIETGRKACSLSKSERINLARLLKGLRVAVDSLLDFNHAMITSGGASLKEIDPKTMRSKIAGNLFLAGEILDLDGPTGGYNLQIAWTTGYTAGTSAKNRLHIFPS
jgi:predicted Rossmann fold flavoprotein